MNAAKGYSLGKLTLGLVTLLFSIFGLDTLAAGNRAEWWQPESGGSNPVTALAAYHQLDSVGGRPVAALGMHGQIQRPPASKCHNLPVAIIIDFDKAHLAVYPLKTAWPAAATAGSGAETVAWLGAFFAR